MNHNSDRGGSGNSRRFVSKSHPQHLLKLALLQLVCTAFFSLVLYYCFDLREALSAFLGGAVAVLASTFSAWQLYRSGNNLQAEEMLARFYVSTVLKIAFSVAMIAICIIVMQVSTLPFIIAYLLAAVVVNWLILLLPETHSINEETVPGVNK